MEEELSSFFKEIKFEVDLENKNILIFGDDFSIEEIIKKIEELGYIVKE